mmetsp:Transcript_24382/g.37784  ORF Transcript_24382/g.37784 Transcript_24382/m.37784 type:complete len:219 (-) Transcript_24382:1528-2184(-)
MFDDPKDFVTLALDTCDKQSSNIVKTQAAKMFEAICDNIEGSISHSVFFCLQAMNLAISKEKGTQPLVFTADAFPFIEADTPLLENSSFLKNSKPDVVIETSILIIGLLSYVHSKEAFAKVFEAIETTLSHYVSDIVNSESPLIRCRYSLFLGYLVDVIYKTNVEAFKQTILFLYGSVNLGGREKAIALQSIDTLKTVTCDHDLIPRFQQANLLPELL